MSNVGKLIKGEFIVATSTVNGYECISLGNKRTGRTIYPQATARPSRSGWATPHRNIALKANGLTGFLGQGNTPWFRQFDFDSGTYLLNPPIAPPVQLEAMRLSPDETELCVTFNASPYFYRYNAADLVKQADPAVVPTGTPGQPIYSPDGTILVIPQLGTPFFNAYQRSTMTRLANPALLPPNRLIVGDFNPDGTRIAMGGSATSTAPGPVSIYDTTTTPWTRVSTPTMPSATIRGLRYSPDGSKIAILTANAGSTNTLYLYDVAANTYSARTLGATVAGYIAGGANIYWLDNARVVLITEPSANASISLIVFDMVANTVLTNESVMETPFSTCYGGVALPGLTRRRLAGTVEDGLGAPLSRTVRAYHHETGRILGESTSSAVDGSFEMFVYTNDPVTVQAVGSGSEVTKLFDNVVPAPIVGP